MASITREQVAHLARLARIELSDDEPTSHALPITNVMREDVNVPCLTPEQALSGAPAAEEQRFRVPRILSEEA
jgi:aspartyl-tRNA(Asn)/glutamyl-tRNA(Gln) amidotransferase subunit C